MLTSFRALNLEVKIILLGVLLISISTFMLTPFLSLYMHFKDFSPLEIGTVLTIGLIFQQGFTFLGGLLGDRFGYRLMIIVGILVRVLGYLLFATSETLLLFSLSSGLIGIGGSLIVPSTKASIASVNEQDRGKALSFRSMAVNIGASLGPILGGLLYKSSFVFVFLIAALTHVILLLLVIFFVKHFKKPEQKLSLFSNFKHIIVDKNIVYITLVSSGFWFLYTQLTLSIPLYTKEVLNLDLLVAVLFTINGILVIVLQYPLLNYFERRHSLPSILSYGMLFIMAGFLCIFAFPSMISMLVFITLFTVGEVLVAPTLDNAASQIAPHVSKVGGYLGFISLGWAIGGTLGNMLGGFLYTFFNDINDIWIVWILYATLALFCGWSFYRIGKTSQMSSSMSHEA
jgi:MFS transporter, DHA1 family, multidrug resistance protein